MNGLTPIVEIRNVSKSYRRGSHVVPVLSGITFDIARGEFLAIMGPSGSGKSTLLNLIAGIDRVDTGSIVVGGEDITTLAPHQRVARGIACVPQGREIFGRLTVEENLRMGLARFSGAKGRAIPGFVYDTFPVLAEMRHRRGGDLSGGQQQQLAIARALVSEPRLLVLDEPTEGIQPSIIKLIGQVIRQLASRGDMAILLVEQYYDFAAELADSYAVMARGTVIKSGRCSDMAADGVRELLAI